MKNLQLTLSVLLFLAMTGCGNNADKANETDNDDAAQATAEQQAGEIEVNPLKNCYFGDLHLHTALSPDANLFGTNLYPEEAYQYAMGQEVDYMGLKVKRIAPLDFLAVTDHSEYLGVIAEIRKPEGRYAGTDIYKKFNSTDKKDIDEGFLSVIGSLALNIPDPVLNNEKVIKSAWQRVIEAANKYNQPGKFTTFVGYEWTSAPATVKKESQNLHRCVIFKGDKVPAAPFSSFDSNDPENLWTYLENARKNGSDVLAVPHNGNVSNGLMFDTKTLSGKPLTKEYAERRMNNEPLVEMNQGKGTSETRMELSPNDEFANFELFETLLGTSTISKYKTGGYVRQAYGVGQELQEKLGSNPFKYGLEGGTDYHSGISSSEENNYPGSHGVQDQLDKDYKTLLSATSSVGGEPPTKLSAAGLTGVWAESNTRDAIFDALKRKECFATSGTRVKVRMFAGWNYVAAMIRENDWVKQAYAGGVPMGADLVAAATPGKPKFLVQAVKDPNSGNLDRIQIIKVSTKDGRTTEQIFDVVWSGERTIDAKGKLPAVGNTVDTKNATYTNTIGAAELIGWWEDAGFDPQAYTTYYARVLEIPTPRWSTYLSAKYKMPLNTLSEATIQERAWTSPVWYTPVK